MENFYSKNSYVWTDLLAPNKHSTLNLCANKQWSISSDNVDGLTEDKVLYAGFCLIVPADMLVDI